MFSVGILTLIKFVFIFALCSLSLSAFSFGEYTFTGAWLVFLLATKALGHKVSSRYFIGYLAIMCFFLINFFVNSDVADPTEFSKSYFQMLTSPLVLIILYGCRDQLFAEKSFIGKVCISVTFLFVVTQILELMLLGTSESWFFLEQFSISTAQSVDRFQAPNMLSFYRPIGQYHEPSYLALVGFMFFVIDDIHPSTDLLIKALSISIIILSLSATIWFFFVTYLIVFKLRGIYMLLWIPVGIVLLFSLDLLAVFRINEIFIVGSSGWFRIIRPLYELISVLQVYPFGIPVGNNRFIFDNSIYLLMTYLGVLSLPVVLGVAVLAVTRRFNNRILYFVLCCMMVNGAIITVESFLMIGFVIFSSTLPRSTMSAIGQTSSASNLSS